MSRLVLLLFLVAQAYDGLFTYVAVAANGISAEGNMLLSVWMTIVGPIPTLIGAKLLAAMGGLLLYKQGVHRVLAGLTLVYASTAIAPWLIVYHRW
jgi:hypothetical protein